MEMDPGRWILEFWVERGDQVWFSVFFQTVAENRSEYWLYY